MKLYFNYTQNFILADCEGEVIDMRTGKPSDEALQSRLNSFKKETTSKWIPIDDLGNLYEMSDGNVTVVGNTIHLVIDGHKVTATHKSVNHQSYIQLTGYFPRYFWKGFEHLIAKKS